MKVLNFKNDALCEKLCELCDKIIEHENKSKKRNR
jgi:hypothetical protein